MFFTISHKMDFKYWMLCTSALFFFVQFVICTNATSINGTQKDRRFTSEEDDYPIIPPPSRPSFHSRREPTIKPLGQDSQSSQRTTPRYSSIVPKLLLAEQGYSVFTPPKEVIKEDFKKIPEFSSSEVPLPSQQLKIEGTHQFETHQPFKPLQQHTQTQFSLHFPPSPKNHITSSTPRSSTSGPTTVPVYIPSSSTSDIYSIPDLQDTRQDYQHIEAHMVQILTVDVQCSMTSMLVRLKFDGPFGGVVYSKGYFNDILCHYVPYGSGQSEYEFVIAINRCGAQFADFTPGGQASLEDIIVVQNERGIQEIWDTARRIQCTWAGTVEKKVNSAFHVDSLETVAVTYNDDTANAYMDIQLGKGPFATPVTGLVKIGDTITVVIAIEATGEVDVRVKECVAHNGDNRRDEDGQYGKSSNYVRLTDEEGCVLKPKLLSPWRKTRETGSTGASILTFSYLQAFKFPDRMEVYLECSLEICKKQCQRGCHEDEYGYPDSRRDPRVKREVVTVNNGTNLDKEQFVLQRTLRVVSPEELNLIKNGNPRRVHTEGGYPEICLSVPHFVIAIVIIFLAVIACCVATAVISLRKGFRAEMRNTILKKASFFDGSSKNASSQS